MKKLICFINLIFLTSAFAQDAKVPCRYTDGSLGLNTLDSFDCKLANKLSSDPKIKDEYKDFVDKKLAEKLAKKSSDVIEDLALLDSYFDQNGIDLGKNDNVKISCKLEKIAEAECGTNVSKNKIKKKMSFILGSEKYLPHSDNDNNSLYKRMLSKAQQIRSGNKLKEAKSCPVEGDSGDFILSSQFTRSDAKELLYLINKGDSNSPTLKAMYKNYPQLKMLVAGKDDSLKKKFESEMGKFSGAVGTEKDFIDKFFKETSTQEDMAKNVSIKCNELKKSIEKFVCVDDYPHLGMKEDDRDSFFEESNDDKVFKEVSRGLSCLMEEKVKSDLVNNPFNLSGTIQEKYDFYKDGLRIEKPQDDISNLLNPFCSLYLCKDSSVNAVMQSCKNGGPISSLDIIKTCKDNTLLSCTDVVQKYVSYVTQLERDAINSGVGIGSLASNGIGGTSLDGAVQKPRGFSSFYQNFLGVEGTIASEGKKVTPVTIAEKKAEFAERKIESGTGLASLSQNREREVAKIDSRQQEPIIAERETTSGMDAHSASLRDADQFRRTFQAQQFSKPNYDISKDANGKPKKIKLGDQDSSTLDEMKKLRGELAEALGKVKGSEEEQLAAIADNNAVVVAPKGTQKDPVKNLNQGEKERLDAYRDSLNTWENKLRNWQGNLSDRDVRANSGSTATGESRAEAPAPANDQYSIGNNNSGTGVKLNKSAGGALLSGKAETPGERAPGSEKVEGEAGVVNSENLATLGKESLKKLGIVLADSFIIKVRYKEKIYSVPVKTFNHDGKSMYVPLLNDKDRELSKIVYESPLFKDYRNYQIKRQYQLDQI